MKTKLPTREQTPERERQFSGSMDHDVSMQVVREMIAAAASPGKTAAEAALSTPPLLGRLKAFRPQDAIEGMLAMQAVALHTAIMRTLGSAASSSALDVQAR